MCWNSASCVFEAQAKLISQKEHKDVRLKGKSCLADATEPYHQYSTQPRQHEVWSSGETSPGGPRTGHVCHFLLFKLSDLAAKFKLQVVKVLINEVLLKDRLDRSSRAGTGMREGLGAGPGEEILHSRSTWQTLGEFYLEPSSYRLFRC